MDLPNHINRTSPFPILGVLGCIFLFFSPNFNRTFCKQIGEDSDQTLHYAVSDLGLHSLPDTNISLYGLNRWKLCGDYSLLE